MIHVLIDGYNLMAKMDGLTRNLEAQRERFLQALSKYRAQKCHEVIVVFDGEKGGWGTESHERTMGIIIVYSRLGEKADDVIKRMVKEDDVEYTVITSDREIASFAETHGHTAIPSEEFIPKLLVRGGAVSGEWKDDDEYRPVTVKKKGNPRKLSKTARRRKQKLDRL